MKGINKNFENPMFRGQEKKLPNDPPPPYLMEDRVMLFNIVNLILFIDIYFHIGRQNFITRFEINLPIAGKILPFLYFDGYPYRISLIFNPPPSKKI